MDGRRLWSVPIVPSVATAHAACPKSSCGKTVFWSIDRRKFLTSLQVDIEDSMEPPSHDWLKTIISIQSLIGEVRILPPTVEMRDSQAFGAAPFTF